MFIKRSKDLEDLTQMKRKINIFLVMMLMLSVSFSTFAENNDDYEAYFKTVAIGFNPVGYVFFGPSASLEYMGMGPLTISGSYQQIGNGMFIKSLADSTSVDVSGYGIAPALKYYYEYDAKGHDSGYLSLMYSLVSMDFKNRDNDSYIKVTQQIPWLMVGWRWQWSPFFIDFNIGGGWSFAKIETSDNFSKSSRDTLEDAAKGYQYGGNLTMGFAF